MKKEVYRRKVDTQEELLDRILDATARMQKREHRLDKQQHAIFGH
jgi:hypothetical protein